MVWDHDAVGSSPTTQTKIGKGKCSMTLCGGGIDANCGKAITMGAIVDAMGGRGNQYEGGSCHVRCKSSPA